MFACWICPSEFDGDADPECALCGGSREWSLRVCPWSVVPYWALTVVRAISLFYYNQVTPTNAGWFDHPCDLHAAAGIVFAELKAYDVERKRIEDAKRKQGR